jgi:hypothetical protein
LKCISLGNARSVQERGAGYSSSGKTLTATGIETPLTLKYPSLPQFSQYRRAPESAVFVNQLVRRNVTRPRAVQAGRRSDALARKYSGEAEHLLAVLRNSRLAALRTRHFGPRATPADPATSGRLRHLKHALFAKSTARRGVHV